MKISDFIGSKSDVWNAVGLGLSVAATIFAAEAGAKASKRVEAAKAEKGELSKKEIFKLCWKDFVGTAVVQISGIACILKGKTMDLKTISRLSLAYEASSSFARLYGEKVVEQIGEAKNEELKTKALLESAPKASYRESEFTSLYDGDNYFMEPYSGKMFISSTTKINDAVNIFNDKLNTNDEAPIYDIWEAIHDSTPCKLNERLLDGDTNHMMGFIRKNGLVDVRYLEPAHKTINGNKISYTPIQFVDKSSWRHRDPFEYYEESVRWGT